MKPTLFLLALLPLLPVRADDAAPSAPTTEYVKFGWQRQVLILRRYSEVGGIQTAKGVKTDVRIIEASAGNKKVDAVEINGGIIDSDEIPSLLGAIDSILKLDKTTPKPDDIEADYGTRGGLWVSKFTKPDGDPTLSFGNTEVTPKELAEIRDLIAQAQAKFTSHQ